MEAVSTQGLYSRAMRFSRPLAVTLAIFAGTSFVAGLALVLWLVLRTGDWVLDTPHRTYTLGDQRSRPVSGPQGERRYLGIKMADDAGGELSFTVSLPLDFDLQDPDDQLPVLLLFAGFRSAERNLERLSNHGRNAIISYDYPYDPMRWREGSILERIAIGWRVAHDVPDQIVAVTRWGQAQPWSDADRLSIAGVSLGAVFLPVTQRRMQVAGIAPDHSIIAYGGVDIAVLAHANLKIEPAWLNDVAATAIGLMLRPFEPSNHLPHLRGEFLIISGEADERIPAESQHTLERVTPSPKTIVRLPGAHIDGNRGDLIAAVGEIVRGWLAGKDALNP